MYQPHSNRTLRVLLSAIVAVSFAVPLASAFQSGRETSSNVPILDWKQELSLPDDILFVRHQDSADDAIVFLVSLDVSGEVASIQSVKGFSLYLAPVAEQIRRSTFPPNLRGKRFVLRMPDPLYQFISHPQPGACDTTTELRRLYHLGASFWRDVDSAAAAECYKEILARNQSSLAGRYGVIDICRLKRERCGESYIEELAATHPEFIEVRLRIAQTPFRLDSDTTYAAQLEEILKSDLSVEQRAAILQSQVFWLNSRGRIDEAIRAMKRWNAVASGLLEIYPPAVRADVQSAHNGLVLEAKGEFAEAVTSYRIAAAVLTRERRSDDDGRFRVDLGLARSLRKSGNAGEASLLCDRWRTRWKRLVNPPVRHPWELREDGVEEIRGRWEFSCGNPAKGLQLVEAAAAKYPDSNAPFTALAQYYYSVGEIEKARDAEAKASRLLNEWGSRLGQFK